jgi:uncharacterized membrane-anchored protein
MRTHVRVVCAALSLALLPSAGRAQERTIWNIIDWQSGSSTGMLGLIAEQGVPEYCKFADKKGAKKFLEATGNVPSGNELGVLLCDPKADSSYWFVVFDWDESGYVKDDEKSSLDATKMLKTLQDGQDAANDYRRSRGLDELLVTGWERAPYYDTLTNNLTWSVRVRTKDDPEESINHSVRLLGRKGVMSVDLVADPEDMPTAIASFDSALTQFGFFSGQSYAEWKPGDKVAEYGLAALVTGGAGLAAVKLGLFGKAWKFIVAMFLALKKAFIALIIGIGALFKKLFKRKPKAVVPPPVKAVPRPSMPRPAAPPSPANQTGSPNNLPA